MTDTATSVTRIALLHLAPTPAELERNRRVVETALSHAADAGSEWIITPELVTTGYEFAENIGTDWIESQPDQWVKGVAALAQRRRVTVFLSVPERVGDKLYNSMIAIDRTGRIAGRHRKINALRVGAESWSSPGATTEPVFIDGFGRVGMLICADAFTPRIATSLADQGAKALVSSSAWGPGLHGPNGEWEAVSESTSLPVFVCNRTGREKGIDFTLAQSVVANRGRREVSFTASSSTIFLVDWSFADNRLVGYSDIAPI